MKENEGNKVCMKKERKNGWKNEGNKEFMEERMNKKSRKKTEVIFFSALCFTSTLKSDSKIQWKNRDQIMFLADGIIMAM